MNKRMTILRSLPAFGLFWTCLTGKRGYVKEWRNSVRGERAHAIVYLIGDEGVQPITKRVRADAVVVVDASDEAVNRSSRPRWKKDPFKFRWPIVDISARRNARRAQLGHRAVALQEAA